MIHDWLTGMRGGEVVLEAILELFPDADLFTLIHNPGTVSAQIEGRRVETSFIDKLPFKKSRYRHYLPLFPSAIELFDLRKYDLVVSSSHCVAKGVIAAPGCPHISYIHSPMRYVWDMYHDYFPYRGLSGRWAIPFFSNYLRMWDAASASRVDRYVSNSAFVGERISKYYGRSSVVVPPPCIDDDHRVPVLEPADEYYVVLSALVPYKRIDLAVEAFKRIARPLVVIGKGPEEKRLRRDASANIRFLGEVPRQEAIQILSRARGLVFPGLEDFGIVPVEAQSLGVPVIAFGKGGALETVVDGRTGVFFHHQDPESVISAVEKSETIRWKRESFQKNINRFTHSAFQAGFAKQVGLVMERGRVE